MSISENTEELLKKNYSIKNKNNALIWASVCSIIILSAIYIYVDANLSENHIWKAIPPFLLVVIISLLGIVLDKVRLLSPIERRIIRSSEVLQKLGARAEDRILQIQANANAQQQSGMKELNSSIESLKNYQELRDAQLEYGIISINKSHELPLNVIKEASSGDKVSYMTTFIDADATYCREIEQALLRGADVRLLLMMPDVDAAVVRARNSDFYSKIYGEDVRPFVANIYPKAKHILDRKAEMEQRIAIRKTNFSVRFYSISLNFPMIFVQKQNSEQLGCTAMYTGFYAGANSEDLPYIKWEGDSILISSFVDLFEAKWDACHRNSDLESIGKVRRVSTEMPAALHAQLEQYADKTGQTTTGAAIVEAINEMLSGTSKR